MKPATLVGRRFGDLTVIDPYATPRTKRSLYWCICVCGTKRTVAANDLVAKRVTSCGCDAWKSTIRPTILWTEERVEKLKALFQTGISCSAMAEELGGFAHTADNGRSAVIGKLHRLGLKRSAELRMTSGNGLTKADRKKNKNKSWPTKPKPVKPTSPLAKVFAAEPFVEGPELVIPPAERKGLVDLEGQDCHWPIGDPKDAAFHFCGRRAAAGLPYCEHHARRAYRPPEVRRVFVPWGPTPVKTPETVE